MHVSPIPRGFVGGCFVALAWPLVLWGALTSPSLAAEPGPPAAADRLGYTLGVRAKVSDLGNPLQGMKFAPRFGLRYGKWKLGIGDGREWLQFSGFVAERGLSYQVTESDRWQLNASARAFNASTGSRYDINEPDSLKGKLGIQASGSVNFALTPVWSAGVSVTHDLLGDGNGQTVGVGVSRAISMGETRVLYLSAGVTWGSAQHWQTAHDRGGHPQATLASGLGLLGLGLAYRHALSPTRAWYAKANTGVSVGQPRTLYGGRPTTSGEVGMLWFTR